jgi:hypothetical protein
MNVLMLPGGLAGTKTVSAAWANVLAGLAARIAIGTISKAMSNRFMMVPFLSVVVKNLRGHSQENF